MTEHSLSSASCWTQSQCSIAAFCLEVRKLAFYEIGQLHVACIQGVAYTDGSSLIQAMMLYTALGMQPCDVCAALSVMPAFDVICLCPRESVL